VPTVAFGLVIPQLITCARARQEMISRQHRVPVRGDYRPKRSLSLWPALPGRLDAGRQLLEPGAAECRHIGRHSLGQVVGSDLRLRVRLRRRGRETRRYYYPDAMVLCDPTELCDDDAASVSRPCRIFEILSSRSARIDRTEKLEIYQAIPSVQAYVIVHQQEQRVESYARASAGGFEAPLQLGPDASLDLPCINTRLSVAAIYRGR
jgi:hypothetical protein